MMRFLRPVFRVKTEGTVSQTPNQRGRLRTMFRLRHPQRVASMLALCGAGLYLLFASPFDEQDRIDLGKAELVENFYLTNWSPSPIGIQICCNSHGLLLDETMPSIPTDGEPPEFQTYIQDLANGDCVHTLTIRFQDSPSYRSNLDLCASRFVIVRRNRQVLFEKTRDAFVDTEYSTEWTGAVKAQSAHHQ